MFISLQNISIKYKITILVTIVCTMTLAVGFTVALKNDINLLRKDFEDLAAARAQLIGEYSVAPLSFHDKKGCIEILKKASTSLDFHSAELYDEKGNMFARYGESEERIAEHIKLIIDTAIYIPNTTEIRFSHVITHDKHLFGYLILHTSTDKLDKEIRRDIKVLIVSAFIIILLGVVLSFYAQRAVTNPIFKLEKYLNHVTEDSNVSKTVQVKRKDEIGKIYVAINKLLSKIQSKSKERDEIFSTIEANNKKLGSTLEAFSDGYWEYDLENKTWFFSDLWLETFGFSRDNIQTSNEDWENTIHLDDLEHYKKELQKHLEGITVFFDAEFRILVKKGGYKWVHFKGKWAEKNGSQVSRILGITDNTNNIKENESLLLSSNKRAINDQKLIALSQMVSGVSHSIKNILTPIYGYADFGLMTIKNDDILKKELELIKHSAHEADLIVEDLLAFASEPNNDFKTRIDIKSILESLVSRLASASNKNVKLTLTTDLNEATILGVKSKISHAISHLIKNAIDASFEGDSVEIDLSYLEINDSNKVKYQEASSSEHVRIIIKDQGQGIKEELLDRIFEPFFTTKEIGTGVGLGLSVATGIIRSHRGHIFITSESLDGTTAEIILPVI